MPAYLQARGTTYRLSILHTNDTHSRIDPYPVGSSMAGMGGIAARMELLRTIRSETAQSILLDSGDFFQGTPFFNFYKGEVEIRAMQQLGYDVATLGNHDFDAGMDNLYTQLKKAEFPVVCSNYSFGRHALSLRCQPSLVIRRDVLKIGVFGLGINPQGLIPPALSPQLKYLDPFQSARQQARRLRILYGCHMVICLSHLGLGYADDRPSDRRLAREVSGIDLIVGGHTHSFLDQPELYFNPAGQPVYVVQAGHSGLRLGKVDWEIKLGKKTEVVPVDASLISVGSGMVWG
jgi:5'-nucleotidase